MWYRYIDIDTYFSGILLDLKLNKEKNKNILIYGISYKTLTGAKPLRIRCNLCIAYFLNAIILIKSVVNKNQEIKINTAIIYFQKKVHMKINLIENIFKWMFLYYKCYISIELTFLKEVMLIKQVDQKGVIFVTIGIS